MFDQFPDLASRALAGSVMWASDESFADKENLISAHDPIFDPTAFGNKGKIYDGWETRRRRDGRDYDEVIVRLGVPGIIHGIIIDTRFFTGNYPPTAAVYGLLADPLTPVEQLRFASWTPLVQRSELAGDSPNEFSVEHPRRFSHIKLRIFPDGGVARLRVHGQASPDPRLLRGTIDLAAAEHGGRVVDCSNKFYSSPTNLLLPDRARSMAEGWENARRRQGDHDFVEVALAGPGRIERIEIDTSYFLHNAPGQAELIGYGQLGEQELVPATVLLPATALLPDTRHQFFVDDPGIYERVRLRVFPDGGIARLRVWGQLV